MREIILAIRRYYGRLKEISLEISRWRGKNGEIGERGEGNGHGENALLARVPFGLFRRSQELRASASISRMDERHVGWLFEPEGERNHGFVEQLFVRNISEEEEAGGRV